MFNYFIAVSVNYWCREAVQSIPANWRQSTPGRTANKSEFTV